MKEISIIILGLIFIVIGLTNRTGKPSVIHWYNYAKVESADRPKYGKTMSNAIVCLGASLVITGAQLLIWPDSIPFVVGLGIAAWMFMTLSAQLMYNRGFL